MRKIISGIACAASLLAVAGAYAAGPVYRAVCVGVNEYDTDYVPRDNWLQGWVGDEPPSDVLAAPEGLDNSGISATSFTANWDAVAGAASYLLVVAESDFEEDDEPDSEEWAEPDFQFSQTVTGTSFTVDGLIPGTYYWRVCAVGNGTGPFSETAEVTLYADPSAPPSIRRIGDIAVPVGSPSRRRPSERIPSPLRPSMPTVPHRQASPSSRRTSPTSPRPGRPSRRRLRRPGVPTASTSRPSCPAIRRRSCL